MTQSHDKSPIPDQVTLPVRVAVEVVMQGLRIRFGRSVVTVSGVVLGIAFLMSIFTGLILKNGVASEENLRIETNRMLSFLIAESGLPKGHVMGLLMEGPLYPSEKRLLQKLDEDGLSELRVAAPQGVTLPSLPHAKVRAVQIKTLGVGVSAILCAGGGAPADGWLDLFKDSRQNVLALTRTVEIVAPPENIRLVRLASSPSEKKLARDQAELKKARFRNGWIVGISLLVTIIGISNAMLMSVTERFREIGTMKCLGALSAFVRSMFLIESGFMGLVGGLIGCLFGLVFSLIAYSVTYGFDLTFYSLLCGLSALLLYSFLCIAAGFVLSLGAALYPANIACNMVPANALRSNI